MDDLFPFGFPAATALYFVLYTLTWALHFMFMNYVLAGSSYLVISTFPRGAEREESAMSAALRDWLPFFLGLAITAGVGPLLFVQLLYREDFYTANLLLFYRWMLKIPLLVAGFYLLYLLKCWPLEKGWPKVRFLCALSAWICFGFTAYSFTLNHIVSRSPEVWTKMYVSGLKTIDFSEVLSRLAFWVASAFPTMCALLGWQLLCAKKLGKPILNRAFKHLAVVGMLSIIAALIFGGMYFRSLTEPARDLVTGKFAGLYFWLLLGGWLLQFITWVELSRSSNPRARLLYLQMVGGLAMCLIGLAVVREAIRLSSLDISLRYDQHSELALIGGLPIFLFFLVVNAALIFGSVRTVLAQVKYPEPESQDS